MAVLLAGEHRAGGEDRAAEVAEHDHAVAARRRESIAARDAVGVGAEAAVGRAAGALDAHVGARPSGRRGPRVPEAISRLCDTTTIPTTLAPFRSGVLATS